MCGSWREAPERGLWTPTFRADVSRLPMTANDVPEISVVIPTHNRWSFLSTLALPSALGQQQTRHEVVVVDDGSDDETSRLHELDHRRLRVIRHERPLGVSAARNAGVDAARGEWVAFLDDDDLWSPLKLRHQLDALRASRASFVYSDIVVRDERRGVTYELMAPESDDLESKLLARYVIPGGPSNIVASTELVRRLGGFDENLSMTADWDLWLRLARAGKGVRCPGVLVATTAHTANMPVRSSWRELALDLDRFVAKHAPDGLAIDRAGFARWLALQRQGAGSRLDPAYRLIGLSLRYRRPRYALQGVRLLLLPRASAPTKDHATAAEPEWLLPFRKGDHAF